MTTEAQINRALNRITDNARDFHKQLLVLSAYTRGSVEDLHQKVGYDMVKQITFRTPKDIGRAKTNWQIGLKVTDEVYDEPDEEGQEQRVEEFLTEDFDLENTIWIYNNLGYIEALEAGHSQAQAPNGMVAVTLAEFTHHWEEAAKTFTIFKT